MNTLKENIITFLHKLEEEFELTLYFVKYSHYILQLLSLVVGFMLGRYLKKNTMNEYLDFFRNSLRN